MNTLRDLLLQTSLGNIAQSVITSAGGADNVRRLLSNPEGIATLFTTVFQRVQSEDTSVEELLEEAATVGPKLASVVGTVEANAVMQTLPETVREPVDKMMVLFGIRSPEDDAASK